MYRIYLRGWRIRRWLRLVKFAHTLFALPFTLVATVWNFSVGEPFHWWTLSLIVLCMVFARNAAMGYNRLVDWRFDALNPRTASREIPRGIISPRSARRFVLANALLFVLCAWQLNTIALYLSPLALGMLLGYSHTKRFTLLCHFWLGATLGLAPLGAAVAIRGGFGGPELLLALAVMLWVAGFDIIYALHDEDFDRLNRLHSAPSRLGRARAIWLARVCHMLAVALFACLHLGCCGGYAWGGLLLFTSILLWQHTRFSPRSIRRVNPGFMLINGVNSLTLSGFMIIDVLL